MVSDPGSTGGRAWQALPPVLLVLALACTPASDRVPATPAEAVELEPVSQWADQGTLGDGLTVVSLTMTPSGTVYLVDFFPPFIRVFDREGNPRLSLGRRGEGPGEMGRPSWVYANDDGSFYVHDGAPPRLMEFDASGSFRSTLSLPMSVVAFSAYDATARQVFLVSYVPAAVGGEGPRVERWDMETGESETVVSNPDRFPHLPGDPGRAWSAFPIATAPRGFFAIGDPLEYKITVFDRDGRVLQEFGRDIPRPRKSEKEIETEEKEGRQLRRSIGVTKGLEVSCVFR